MKANMTRSKGNPATDFQPRIACFVCNWSAYSAVEMAGAKKEEYPANLHLVKLTCLGRLHPGLILKAFELGADGDIWVHDDGQLAGLPGGSGLPG